MREFFRFVLSNWPEILALTSEHVLLVLVSTGAAVLIGIPLGVLVTRRKTLQAPILGAANILQTVPSLALFGLLIPLPFIGGIGARTAIIALALYGLLPIIRNTVTGILGIDPKIKEAAVAMGMTDGQVLRMVELPLAAPVILTGIRVAVVIGVGVATVAAAVGAGGLGTYIFRGLRQYDNNLIVAGALASALLALFIDFLLGQLGASFRTDAKHHTARRIVAGAGILLLAGVALVTLVPGLGLTNAGSPMPETPNGGIATGERIVVGSKDFTESIILAEILAQSLEQQGIAVERIFELGGNVAHESLVSGRIDVYPEYTGTAFTAILKHSPINDPQEVFDRTKAEYSEKFGFVLSPPLGFANDFAILVRGEAARQNNLKTISDAGPISRDWQAGFGQDFMSREDGYRGFVAAYGFNFAKQPREMDLSLTYRALRSGELDIIAGNSTDGLISALDLFQLADDKRYFPPYQAVFIARHEKSGALMDVFQKLNNAISTEEMRRLNYEVDGNKRTPKDAAAEWVSRLKFR